MFIKVRYDKIHHIRLKNISSDVSIWNVGYWVSSKEMLYLAHAHYICSSQNCIRTFIFSLLYSYGQITKGIYQGSLKSYL